VGKTARQNSSNRLKKSQHSKMGSNAQDIKILSRKQQLLPEAAFQELKGAVQGEVIIKGKAPDDVYRAALDRWNKAWIQEAVSYLPKLLPLNFAINHLPGYHRLL